MNRCSKGDRPESRQWIPGKGWYAEFKSTMKMRTQSNAINKTTSTRNGELTVYAKVSIGIVILYMYTGIWWHLLRLWKSRTKMSGLRGENRTRCGKSWTKIIWRFDHCFEGQCAPDVVQKIVSLSDCHVCAFCEKVFHHNVRKDLHNENWVRGWCAFWKVREDLCAWKTTKFKFAKKTIKNAGIVIIAPCYGHYFAPKLPCEKRKFFDNSQCWFHGLW